MLASQSLWNRAVSSDIDYLAMLFENNESQSLWNRAVSSDICGKLNIGWGKIVSIPLEQGSVFRQKKNKKHQKQSVSIPLEQGSVFRQSTNWLNIKILSQSLWNRAVSSDCSGILKPCGTRLTRATSQLFPRLRELGLDLIKYCTIFNILFTYQAVENRGDFTRVFRFY